MDVDDLIPAERRLAEALGRLAVTPSPEARARLLAAVRQAPHPPAIGRRRPAWLGGWRRVVIGAAAGLVLVGTAGAGAMALSAHALPGSPAYALRLAGEHLRLWLATPGERERLRLDFAREHLSEARQADGGNRAAAQTLLHDAAAYLADAGRDLADPGVDAGTRAALARELQSLEDEEKALDAAIGPAPSPDHAGPNDTSPAPGRGQESTPGASGTPAPGAGSGKGSSEPTTSSSSRAGDEAGQSPSPEETSGSTASGDGG